MARKKIAYQGKPGAYSDIACRAAFPRHEPLSCSTFLDVFIALDKGEADLAMIPIDNSIAGRVADIHHLLPQYPFYTVAEHFLPIEHCLLGVKGSSLKTVRKVYSHTHALPQCAKLIRKMKWEPHVAGDTAGSAEKVAQMNDHSCAAIASSLCAKIYGLNVLKTNIADRPDNVTRFVALSKKPYARRKSKDKDYVTSFIFNVRNVPAALYKALGGFATNGVNMLKIESYMQEGGFNSTLFYCEVSGHADDQSLKNSFEEVRFFAKDFRVLGSYIASPYRMA